MAVYQCRFIEQSAYPGNSGWVDYYREFPAILEAMDWAKKPFRAGTMEVQVSWIGPSGQKKLLATRKRKALIRLTKYGHAELDKAFAAAARSGKEG